MCVKNPKTLNRILLYKYTWCVPVCQRDVRLNPEPNIYFPMTLVKVKKSNKIPPSNLISITNAHDIVLSNVTIQGSSRQVR